MSVEEGKAVTDLRKLPGDLLISIEEGGVVTYLRKLPGDLLISIEEVRSNRFGKVTMRFPDVGRERIGTYGL
jgi:hypothetical protein